MADSGADRDVIGEQTIKRLNIGTTNAELRVVTVDNEIISKRKIASYFLTRPIILIEIKIVLQSPQTRSYLLPR